MDGEVEWVSAIVKCGTHGCGNAGIEIHVSVGKDDPYVVCGVCRNKITDIVLVSD